MRTLPRICANRLNQANYDFTCNLYTKDKCKGDVTVVVYTDPGVGYVVDKPINSISCFKNPINSGTPKPAPLGG